MTPPGHLDSVALGCTCPVLDNAHGKGCGYLTTEGEPVFIVSEACPIHGEAEFFPADTRFARDLSGPAYGAAVRVLELRRGLAK